MRSGWRTGDEGGQGTVEGPGDEARAASKSGPSDPGRRRPVVKETSEAVGLVREWVRSRGRD